SLVELLRLHKVFLFKCQIRLSCDSGCLTKYHRCKNFHFLAHCYLSGLAHVCATCLCLFLTSVAFSKSVRSHKDSLCLGIQVYCLRITLLLPALFTLRFAREGLTVQPGYTVLRVDLSCCHPCGCTLLPCLFSLLPERSGCRVLFLLSILL